MDPIERQLELVRKARTLFWWVSVVLLGVGLALLVRSIVFVRSAQPADAVVTDVESRSSRDTSGKQIRMYTPTFKFEGAGGRQHVVQLNHSSSAYDYTVGERVRILYEPADPQRVRVHSFFGTWGATLVVLGVGLGSALFAFVSSSAAKTLASRQEQRSR